MLYVEHDTHVNRVQSAHRSNGFKSWSRCVPHSASCVTLNLKTFFCWSCFVIELPNKFRCYKHLHIYHLLLLMACELMLILWNSTRLSSCRRYNDALGHKGQNPSLLGISPLQRWTRSFVPGPFANIQRGWALGRLSSDELPSRRVGFLAYAK